MDYISSLPETKYVPNVVVLYAGEYIAFRQPDSGLVIDPEYRGLINRISVNPTSIDPIRPSIATNSTSFTLLDRDFVITSLFMSQQGFRAGQTVQIWLGRSGVGMDFADYLELPGGFINKIEKVEGSYNFQIIERRDRLNNGSFTTQIQLAANILDSTTSITVSNIARFPSSGIFKLNDEFISYASKLGNDLQGCVRAEFGSTASAHTSGSTLFLVNNITSRNAINFLLQLLISPGGGGTYDVLTEGAGFNQSLIDVDQLETFRDEFFSDYNFDFKLYNLSSLKSFLENEILYPLGARLRTNNNGKIGLALINRNIFEIDNPVITNDSMTKTPKWAVSDDKVQNRIRISWNWSDGLNLYQSISEYTDADSILEFGAKAFFEVQVKGPKDVDIIDSIANLFLARFAFPRPEIQVNTFVNSSYLNIGDKTELTSDLIPNDQGSLDFESTLEVVKKSYNIATGDVQFTLAFTSFSGLRQCFIAPSDTLVGVTNQKTVTFAAGRGAHYRVGWKMRLYSNALRDYADTQVNEIASIAGDVITFVDNWVTVLSVANYKIVFADFENTTDQQKRFCFVSEGTDLFPDNSNPYQITFS